MAGHGDVTFGGLLVQSGGQFTRVQKPALKFRDRVAAGRARLQLIEQRTDLRPIAEISLRRNETPGRMLGQILERQQTHAGEDTATIADEKAGKRTGSQILPACFR